MTTCNTRVMAPVLDDELLRLSEAAAALKLSVRTVRRLAARGVLTRIRIGGASRVRRSEVEQLMRSGAQT